MRGRTDSPSPLERRRTQMRRWSKRLALATGRVCLRDRHGGDGGGPADRNQAATVASPDATPTATVSSDDRRGAPLPHRPAQRGTPTATVSATAPRSTVTRRTRARVTPTTTASLTAPRWAATAPIRASGTPTATAFSTATRSPATRRTHANGTPTATGGATGRDQEGHGPSQPPQSSRFPPRGQRGCAARNGARRRTPAPRTSPPPTP